MLSTISIIIPQNSSKYSTSELSQSFGKYYINACVIINIIYITCHTVIASDDEEETSSPLPIIIGVVAAVCLLIIILLIFLAVYM